MVKNTLVFNGTVRLLCKKINDILVCFFGKDVHSQMDSIYAKENNGEYGKIQSRIVIFIQQFWTKFMQNAACKAPKQICNKIHITCNRVYAYIASP